MHTNDEIFILDTFHNLGKKEHLEQLWHCRQALLQPGIWKRLIKMNLCNLGELQMEDKEKKQMLTTELTKEKSMGVPG